MTNWQKLPTELRWMVFDFLKEPGNYLDGRETDCYAPARYASVCREWQPIFEPRNFRHLVLDQDRLPGFKRFVVGMRRGYVRSIVLRVKLGEYDCSACELEEDSDTSKKNDMVFIKTLSDLLRILSTWKKADNTTGIMLDLGAYSPSDGKHTFRDHRLTEGYPYLPGHPRRPARDTGYQRHHASSLVLDPADQCPGWTNTLKGQPSVGARKRAVATICDPGSGHFSSLFTYKHCGRRKWRKFPRANVVYGLTIRRHYSRIISPAVLSRLLRHGLPVLRSLGYEKWSGMDVQSRQRFDRDILALLSEQLPPTLKTLQLFEDTQSMPYTRQEPQPDLLLGPELNAAARNLTCLSVASLTDAVFFFLEFLPSVCTPEGLMDFPRVQVRPDFPHLRRLVLSSRYLQPGDVNKSRRTGMLMLAGVAALYRMPKLRVMEIWGAGAGGACVFRYTRESPNKLVISCVSSFEMDGLGLRAALKAWRAMAACVVPRAEVGTRVRHVKGWRVQSCSELWDSRRLVSVDEVVQPVSRLQMKFEEKLRRGGDRP